MKENGYEESEICVVTDIPDYTVKRILEDEEENKEIIKANWENKVPVMREIISMGLDGIKEAFKEMADPDIRRAMIEKVSDLAALTKIVTDLNMLLRLEEGKSTQNIDMNRKSFQETRVVLQNLARVDPVFNYPVGSSNSGSESEQQLLPAGSSDSEPTCGDNERGVRPDK
jgi:flagellin-specific chaperone FliS